MWRSWTRRWGRRGSSFSDENLNMLAEEQPSPEQIAIFRAMSPERRLQLAEQLYWSARKMKAAGVRMQHPDWSEEQITAEVRRIFTHART